MNPQTVFETAPIRALHFASAALVEFEIGPVPFVLYVSHAGFGLATGVVADVAAVPLALAVGAVFAGVAIGPEELEGPVPFLPGAPGVYQLRAASFVEVRPDAVFVAFFVEALYLQRAAFVEGAVGAVFYFSALVQIELEVFVWGAALVLAGAGLGRVGRGADGAVGGGGVVAIAGA